MNKHDYESDQNNDNYGRIYLLKASENSETIFEPLFLSF